VIEKLFWFHEPHYSVTHKGKFILSDCLEIGLLEVFAHQPDPPDSALQPFEIGTNFGGEVSQQSFAYGCFIHAVLALPAGRKNIFGILKDSAPGARVYHRRLEEWQTRRQDYPQYSIQ